MKLFEDDLHKQSAIRKQLKAKHLRVQVLFLPVHRDRLIPALLEGRGDIAAALRACSREEKPPVRSVVRGRSPVLESDGFLV